MERPERSSPSRLSLHRFFRRSSVTPCCHRSVTLTRSVIDGEPKKRRLSGSFPKCTSFRPLRQGRRRMVAATRTRRYTKTMSNPLTPDEIRAFNLLPPDRQQRIRSMLAAGVGRRAPPSEDVVQEAARYVATQLRFTDGTLSVGEVYADYAAWSPRPMSKRQFSRSLLALGVRHHPARKTARRWDGVGWAT